MEGDVVVKGEDDERKVGGFEDQLGRREVARDGLTLPLSRWLTG